MQHPATGVGTGLQHYNGKMSEPAVPSGVNATLHASGADDKRAQARLRRSRRHKRYWPPTSWPLGYFAFAATALAAAIGGVIFWVALATVGAPDAESVGATRAAQTYDLARLAVTLLGVLTVGGAAAVAYRRQMILEHQRGNELHRRYQDAAAQLANRGSIIRIAGIYALESLAIEWTLAGNVAGRNICIDLLCGYLRSTTGLRQSKKKKRLVMTREEVAVRDLLVSVIRRHLTPIARGVPSQDWSDHTFNFGGAHFGQADFSEVSFGAPVTFAAARFRKNAGTVPRTAPVWWCSTAAEDASRTLPASTSVSVQPCCTCSYSSSWACFHLRNNSAGYRSGRSSTSYECSVHKSSRLASARFASGGISIHRGPPGRRAWMCATRLLSTWSPVSLSCLYRGREQSGRAHRNARAYRRLTVAGVGSGCARGATPPLSPNQDRCRFRRERVQARPGRVIKTQEPCDQTLPAPDPGGPTRVDEVSQRHHGGVFAIPDQQFYET